MNYKEQLESKEWQEKRNEILKRDNFECKNCNKKRSKFINLSKKFGIKTIEELNEDGWKVNKKNNDITISKNDSSSEVEFIGSEVNEIILDNLKFARQWKKSKHQFVFDSYIFICFYENISIEDEFPDLNVHHNYYIKDKKAWEYEDEALITLCHKCHKAVHEQEKIYVYSQKGEVLYEPEICERCGGSGYVQKYSYYQNGICFGCHGEGVKFKE